MSKLTPQQRQASVNETLARVVIGHGPATATLSMLGTAFSIVKADLEAAGADDEDLEAVLSAFEKGIPQAQGPAAEHHDTTLNAVRCGLGGSAPTSPVEAPGVVVYDFRHAVHLIGAEQHDDRGSTNL